MQMQDVREMRHNAADSVRAQAIMDARRGNKPAKIYMPEYRVIYMGAYSAQTAVSANNPNDNRR